VFRDANWRGADVDRRLTTGWGIAQRGTSKNASRSTVHWRLGKHSTEGSLGGQYYLSHEGLELMFLVSLLPPFEDIALRLPVEIALTVPAAARWIDRPFHDCSKPGPEEPLRGD
jgi:hypothetical protein